MLLNCPNQQVSAGGPIDLETAVPSKTVTGVSNDPSVLPTTWSHQQLMPDRRHQHELHHEPNLQDIPSGTTWKMVHKSPHDLRQPERNRSTARSHLPKRADPDNRVDFEYYRCKGEKYLGNMRAATSKLPKWSFDKLAENGWKIKPGSITEFSNMLQRALTDLHVFPPDGKHYDTIAAMENEFTDHHGVKK
ncbi:MAG: hypothetical protein L6R41_008156, partial [Letrouitia leprolyta]